MLWLHKMKINAVNVYTKCLKLRIIISNSGTPIWTHIHCIY